MNGLPPRLREAADGGSWAPGPLGLPLRFGEYKLGVVPFDGLVHTEHFLRRAGGLTELLAEGGEQLRRRRAAAVLLPSQLCDDALPTMSVDGRIVRYVTTRFTHYYIELGRSFDQYLSTLSSSRRATVRRKCRALRDAAGSAFAFESVRHPSELSRFLREATALSSKTYQERLLGSGLPTGSEFEQWVVQLAADNRVRGFLIRWGDRPMSYMLCTARGGVLFYDWVGYDPDFAEWSPGTVLQHLALEQLFGEGTFEVFDFTEGGGEHKRAFATHAVPCADIWLLPLAPRSVAALVAHAAMRRTSAALVRLLAAAKLQKRVKRFLRRRA